MSLRFLLDTNVLSEPLAPSPAAGVLEKLRRHEVEAATCAPVWHELVFGATRLPASRKRSAIERYLADVVAATLPILPYDADAASWHGRERARLATQGRAVPFVDGQIAAIAVVNDLTLVTRNARDYSRFSELRVENWFGTKR
ncbi:MAG: type II toxin-antitoxin system VapC family toxin [Candidatus Cybelea sp.]